MTNDTLPIEQRCPTLFKASDAQRAFILAAIQLETYAKRPVDCNVQRDQIGEFASEYLMQWGFLETFEGQDAGVAIVEAADEAFEHIRTHGKRRQKRDIRESVCIVNMFSTRGGRDGQQQAIAFWCRATLERCNRSTWDDHSVTKTGTHDLRSKPASQSSSDSDYEPALETQIDQSYQSRASHDEEKPAILPTRTRNHGRHITSQLLESSAAWHASDSVHYTVETSQTGQVIVCINDSESDDEVTLVHHKRKRSRGPSTDSDMEEIPHKQSRQQRKRRSRAKGYYRRRNTSSRSSDDERAQYNADVARRESDSIAPPHAPRLTFAPGEGFRMGKEVVRYANQNDDVIVISSDGESEHDDQDTHINRDRWMRAQMSPSPEHEPDPGTQMNWEPTGADRNPLANSRLHGPHAATHVENTSGLAERTQSMEESSYRLRQKSTPTNQASKNLQPGKAMSHLARGAPYASLERPIVYTRPIIKMCLALQRFALSCGIELPPLGELVQPKAKASSTTDMKRPTAAPVMTEPAGFLGEQMRRNPPVLPYPGPISGALAGANTQYVVAAFGEFPPRNNIWRLWPGDIPINPAAMRPHYDVQMGQYYEPEYSQYYGPKYREYYEPENNHSYGSGYIDHYEPGHSQYQEPRYREYYEPGYSQYYEPGYSQYHEPGHSQYHEPGHEAPDRWSKLPLSAREAARRRIQSQTHHQRKQDNESEFEHTPRASVPVRVVHHGRKLASYRVGSVVAAGAREIRVENRGRAMLEKMGWSKGRALGAAGREGILAPVEQTFRIGKAGLGKA